MSEASSAPTPAGTVAYCDPGCDHDHGESDCFLLMCHPSARPETGAVTRFREAISEGAPHGRYSIAYVTGLEAESRRVAEIVEAALAKGAQQKWTSRATTYSDALHKIGAIVGPRPSLTRGAPVDETCGGSFTCPPEGGTS